MRTVLLITILVLTVAAGRAVAVEATSESVIAQLSADPVSRLEWGLDRLRRALLENFALDPLTLEPSSPPYFINAGYDAATGTILIEIGRTLASIAAHDAKNLCSEYINRVRGFLSVGKAGVPAVNGISDLAAEYFHPTHAAEPPDRALARALDEGVRLRALVAAPMSGVYSICTARLTNSPIRHVE